MTLGRGLLLLGLSVTALLWVCVVLVKLQARPARPPRSYEWFWQRTLIVMLCANGVLPPLIDIVIYRQHVHAVTVSVVLSPLANHARLAALIAAQAIAFFGLIASVSRRGDLRGAAIVAYLAPWAAMAVASVYAYGTLGNALLLWPMIGGYFWLSRTPVKVLDTLGVLTGVLAIAGIIGGLARPELFTVPESGGTAAKAIFGHSLLAGPFGHPNSFGLAMAFGLPTILLLRPGTMRRVFLFATIIALLWTSERTGIAGAFAALIVMWLLRHTDPEKAKARQARVSVLAVGMVGVCVLAVVLPFAATKPEAFSYRGQIWLASRDYLRGHWLFGQGPDFYAKTAQYANQLGDQAFHGHNLVLHFLTTAGMIGGVALLLLALGLIRRSIAAARTGEMFPAAWTFAYLVIACLEVPTDYRLPGPAGYAVWPVLAVILLGSVTAADPSPVVDAAQPVRQKAVR